MRRARFWIALAWCGVALGVWFAWPETPPAEVVVGDPPSVVEQPAPRALSRPDGREARDSRAAVSESPPRSVGAESHGPLARHERVPLVVRVLDRAGSGVAGARVQWLATRPWTRWGPKSPLQAETETEARSDEAGVAELSIENPFGMVLVSAKRFRSRAINLAGPVEDELTVQLVPEPALLEHGLVFLDARDERPVPGVTLVADGLPVPGESDGEGRLAVPTWALEAKRIEARHEALADVRIEVARLLKADQKVVLQPEVALEISLRGPDGLPLAGQIFPAFHEWTSEGQGTPVFPRAVRASPTVPALVHMPATARVRWMAVSDTGLGAEEDFVVPDARAQLTLYLGDTGALEVEVRRPGEGPVRAIAFYRGGEVTIPAVDGVIEIPFADRLGSVILEGAGVVTEELRRYGRESRAGRVRVTMQTAYELTVEVTGPRGEARPGVRVDANARLPSHPQSPVRGTELPTDHPAWLITRRLGHDDITDARGIATFAGLGEGKYSLTARLNPALEGGRFYVFYAEVRLPEQQRFTWTLPGALRQRIRVVTQQGFEVEGFTLLLERKGTPVIREDVTGGTWDGWIPDTVEALTVHVRRFAPESIEVTRLGDRSTEVVLRPTRPLVVRLRGNVKGLRRVRARFLKPYGELRGEVLYQNVMQEMTAVRKGGMLRLYPPLTKGLLLELSAGRFEFRPRRLPLDEGQMRISVVHRD